MTMSRRRTRLKGGLVEGLQWLKCRVRQDLLFEAPHPSWTSTHEDVDGEARGSAEVVGDEVPLDVLLDDATISMTTR